MKYSNTKMNRNTAMAVIILKTIISKHKKLNIISSMITKIVHITFVMLEFLKTETTGNVKH